MAHFCRGSSTCQVRVADDRATCAGHGNDPARDDIEFALACLDGRLEGNDSSGFRRAEAISALRRALMRLESPTISRRF